MGRRDVNWHSSKYWGRKKGRPSGCSGKDRGKGSEFLLNGIALGSELIRCDQMAPIKLDERPQSGDRFAGNHGSFGELVSECRWEVTVVRGGSDNRQQVLLEGWRRFEHQGNAIAARQLEVDCFEQPIEDPLLVLVEVVAEGNGIGLHEMSAARLPAAALGGPRACYRNVLSLVCRVGRQGPLRQKKILCWSGCHSADRADPA